MFCRWLPLLILLSTAAGVCQANPAADPAGNTQKEPALRSRPKDSGKAKAHPNRMQLDVVVRDGAGNPVAGLQPWDFKLLDDDRPAKITYFRAFGGTSAVPDPPVEVIFVLDFLNLSLQQQGFARKELMRFLQENGGKLAQPVTLMVLTDKGLEVQPRPSLDGRAVAALVDGAHPRITAFSATMGLQGDIERFNRSLTQIRYIADNERRKPGRKLLIWIGPGWPLLDAANTILRDGNRKQYFRAIVELSTWLREAHMTLDSVVPLDSSMGAFTHTAVLYENFLKPVVAPQQAESGDLGLPVLAAETGGTSLGPGNDLVGQIRDCLANAGSYYELTLEAPPAGHADEYHSLKVTVDQRGMTVRTDTGYYDQPPAQ